MSAALVTGSASGIGAAVATVLPWRPQSRASAVVVVVVCVVRV